MTFSRLKNSYSVLYGFAALFIIASFIVRLTLLLLSIHKADLNLQAIVQIFGEGLLFDIGVAVFFILPYTFYLLILPVKWNNTLFNKIVTYFFFSLAVLITMFSFFAEFAFWDEFESRFNFIAVDYLVYTYEVINNIRQSYPLPLLIGGMLALTLMIVWIFQKLKIFRAVFTGNVAFLHRVYISIAIVLIALLYTFKISSRLTETTNNHYQSELAKAGIYAFFSELKSNQLNYDYFYQKINKEDAFKIVRNQLKDSSITFTGDNLSIRRNVSGAGTMLKPNVITITIESLSADFMRHFGNERNLTPTLDSLADKGILFTNMYATGTRTVRGMEALTLALPPTPGNSIVRREKNDGLATVGYIFQQQGYSTAFFYGGDGYFDNMNQYFGSNGYAVTDRGRSILGIDKFKAPHNVIADSFVHFENAWGISDEDLYGAVVRDADAKFKEGKLFYDFVMTTSNHKPYTYPSGTIDIPSGAGRDGAVKYTDYAIGKFINQIKNKPWFSNTIIIFVADHCANSAGKNEINIDKYHIPAIIINVAESRPLIIDKTCSQIDLYPTLLQMLNWTYTSNLYGKNVLSKNYESRLMLGTYQKLAYIKNDSLVILSPQQKVATYLYNKKTNEQTPAPLSNQMVHEAIANYQTAYYLFENAGLKQ